jgi:preprotein translocase subunit SecB
LPPDRPYNSLGQLVDVILRDVTFRRNLDWAWPEEGISYTVDSRTHGEVLGNREHARAHLEVGLDFHSEPEQSVQPFRLELVVTGVFEWSAPELSDEEIEGWISFNGEHLLWPYVRAFVSQITAASGLPTLTLYTIAVPRPHLGRSDDEEAMTADESVEASEAGR